MVATKRQFPLWITNIVIFGILCAVVVTYFFWQIDQAKRAFLDHVKQHTQMVVGVVQLNVRGAVFSKEVTEEILKTFLGNTARFVDYLDSIEPFTPEEITAFSDETNLAGISIYKGSGKVVEGPSKWYPDKPSNYNELPQFKHLEEKHLYLFSWPRQEGTGHVLLGFTAANIEALQTQLSLPHVAETISALPGICYANIEEKTAEGMNDTTDPEVIILNNNGTQVAEARLFVEGVEIVIGMCTDYLALTLNRLWRDFFIFTTVLVLLGVLLSFFLYWQQSSQVLQARNYERQISKQREEATLGRAAASIAHEVRNPLNTLKMGLQRIQIEGNEISSEHQHLVDLMLGAVRRTNGIVSGLLNYARPQTPKKKSMRLDLLVEGIINIYMSRCTELDIKVTQSISHHKPIYGDPDLLHQAVENLFKNAFEAQPEGGFIRIELGKEGSEVFLKLQNTGFSLPSDEAERILEPYFTSKTEGTGLGLSITQRIIQAHEGRMTVYSKDEGTIEITFYLPLTENAIEMISQKKGSGMS
jgi:two-component system sensor histidine kinase HydH